MVGMRLIRLSARRKRPTTDGNRAPMDRLGLLRRRLLCLKFPPNASSISKLLPHGAEATWSGVECCQQLVRWYDRRFGYPKGKIGREMVEVTIRPNKINPAIYGWVMLWAVGLSGSLFAALWHGTLFSNLLIISIVGIIVPAAYICLYWYYMQFPIIKVTRKDLNIKTLWEKWNIPVESIVSVVRKRGFAARRVFGRLLQATRPFWRLEIHYMENGTENDVDIDLTLFRKKQTETLLETLRRLRPDLEMPTLGDRGL
jgi:hypothetical protein